MLTSEGKYNYNAFLLADENTVFIKHVRYLETNKLELLENLEFGNRCLITTTQRILDRLDVENLRVSFKYKENPFEYDDTAKNKSSKLESKKSSKLVVSEHQILELCKTEKSLKEITEYFGYKDVYKFKNNYINKLLEENKLRMTIPDKPKSRNQKYIIK